MRSVRERYVDNHLQEAKSRFCGHYDRTSVSELTAISCGRCCLCLS